MNGDMPPMDSTDFLDTVVVDLPNGDSEITFTKEEEVSQPEFDANLADFLDETDLAVISTELIEAFESDLSSRSQWEKTYIQGLDLLGLKFEDRTEPWDGACGVFHPMLTDSIIRFQSQTVQEIFPVSGPVKCAVVGTVTLDKTAQ